MKTLMAELRISIGAVAGLAILLCGLYPLLVWAIAQSVFPEKANGSLLHRDGRVVGSRLIAQRFEGAKYFHPRPSSAGDGYDAANSGGSNLGPTSRKLIETVAQRAAAYRAENGLTGEALIPADAVTASASGLDPHITVANANLQAGRVGRSRGMTEQAVRNMIAEHTEGRALGLLGEPRVNVVTLNLALDNVR
jgi:K+-transporting ATPase ATPase C chain